MVRVVRANATYTGGNIYQYTGQFDNGNFFQTWTDYEELQELDTDPEKNWDDNGDDQWQNEHTVSVYYGSEAVEILKEAMRYILKNRPLGNYSLSEVRAELNSLEEQLKELEGKRVRIVFEDGTVADITGEIVLAEENRLHIIFS